MTSAIEQRGFFWWFNDPFHPAQSKATSVPGLLTVTADGRTTLDVDGVLAADDEHSDWSKPRIFGSGARIAGILDTPGDHILLEGVERTDFSISQEAPRKQSFIAETCTQRSFPFPDDYKQDNFVELRIDLKGLEDWLELDSIEVAEDYTTDDVKRSQVSYKDHKFEFRIDGGTFSIESMTTGANIGVNVAYLFGNRPVRSVHFNQSFYMTFHPDAPTHLSYLHYIFAKVEQLLSLLLGSYFRLAKPTFLRKEEPFDSWNTVFSSGDAPSAKELDRLFILVPFTDIRDRFGPLLQSWLNRSKEYGAGFYLYIASLRNPQMYTEDRLFTFATAIEVLHRRSLDSETAALSIQEKERVEKQKERVKRVLSFLPKDNEDREWLSNKLTHTRGPSLKDRLLDCLHELPLKFSEIELENFVKSCVTRRNDISHRGGPSASTDYAFSQEVLQLSEALGYLLHGLILHKIGFPEDALIRAITKSWVAKRLIRPAFEAVGLNIRSESPAK